MGGGTIQPQKTEGQRLNAARETIPPCVKLFKQFENPNGARCCDLIILAAKKLRGLGRGLELYYCNSGSTSPPRLSYN